MREEKRREKRDPDVPQAGDRRKCREVQARAERKEEGGRKGRGGEGRSRSKPARLRRLLRQSSKQDKGNPKLRPRADECGGAGAAQCCWALALGTRGRKAQSLSPTEAQVTPCRRRNDGANAGGRAAGRLRDGPGPKVRFEKTNKKRK